MKKEMPKQYEREKVEEKWKEIWEKEGIYKFEEKSDKPVYSVDTPPPYVSADHLHAGHLMSYAQAEFIVRYKRMKGFNVYYPMGFDDNGLPTERYVEKKYNIDKSKTTKSEFVKLCLKETESGMQNYKKLWMDLGVSVDWSKTYSTINPTATKVSQWSVLDLYRKGALYRKESPVLWCPHCQTAISQADLEHKEDDSKMNFIYFGSKEDNLVVATTRPEMLAACVALYVNSNDERYVGLVGKKVKVPIFDYEVEVKTSDKVDRELGTGLMMVCTWGDQEDLEKWKADGLDTRVLVTEDGKLNELGGKYQGMTLLDARKTILADLQEQGLLQKQEDVVHTMNIHERCSTPSEFVMSKQWFIRISEMKDIWLKYGRDLKWYPDFKYKDYETWVDSIKWDWCISRQRYYGVPFPIWFCGDCGEVILAEEKDLPVDPMEDDSPVKICPKCQSVNIIPEKDVMDTWATSSCTPFLIRELVGNSVDYDKLFPVDLRPNAFEIIRTWDFYSIVKSHYNFGKLPFTNVMVSGHGMDEKGRKFSKRLGNFVPADELVKLHGADPIRYWATGAGLGQNLRFNQEEVEKGKKTSVKLWNAARFLTMLVDDFGVEDELKWSDLEAVDKWILDELNKTIEQVSKAYEEYTYVRARDIIEAFFWSKFTDYYLEMVKYRLYGENESSKLIVQKVLARAYLSILKMYAPILPFVTEEIYNQLFVTEGDEKSIHQSSWPEATEIRSDLDISDFGQVLMALDEIRKYKTSQGLSLGKELDEYFLETKVDLDKYGDLIKGAIKVKELKIKN